MKPSLILTTGQNQRFHQFALLLLLLMSFALPASDKPSASYMVGFVDNALPYTGRAENNQPVGFAIDVLREISIASGLQFQFRAFDNPQQAMAALEQGEVDVIPAYQMSRDAPLFALYTDPLIRYSVALFVRQSSKDIQGHEDLRGKTIGVISDHIASSLLDNIKPSTVKRYSDIPTTFLALLAGDVDALVYDAPVIWKIMQDAQFTHRVRQVSPALAEQSRVIAVHNGNAKLHRQLQFELVSLMASNSFRPMVDRWFMRSAPESKSLNVYWILGALAVLMVISFLAWRYTSLSRFNRGLLMETSNRKLTESQLRMAKEALENRVRERTDELERVTERFSGLFDSIDSAIIVYRPDSGITLHNSKAERILHLQRDKETARTIFNPSLQFMDEDRNLLRAEQYPIETILRLKKPLKGRLSGIRWPGNKRITWVLVNGLPLFDNDNNISEVIISIVDVTDIQHAKERLHQAATVFANTAEGVTITDLKGNIVDVNQAFTNITGYSKKEIIGKNPRLLQSTRHDSEFYEQMWNMLIETGHWRGEIWNRRKNGEEFPELLTISRITDAHRQTVGYVGVFSDITSIKASESKMEYLAHHDALTDLPNRLLFNDRLNQGIKHAARQKNRLAVIFVDLDRFKTINDSLSHPVGDTLLKQVSARLLEAVRDDDTVARISGDEFIILLENIINVENVTVAVEKIMAVFNEPFKTGDYEVRMTCSLGVSLYPDDSVNAAQLMQNADAAMYQAKENGRNAYQFYTQELNAAAFEDGIIENAIRGALDKGELSLVYQPQVDLGNDIIIGMESLLRWDHPELGIVSPTRFIPIAEKTGVIREIGEWVLTSVCKQARLWLDRGINFGYISVNVSGQQIQSGNFSMLVEKLLKETHIPPHCIELEVTESFVMKHTEGNISQLESIQSLGVKLAIDDFGTGYSSLSYLKTLPIDKIKIDQSFVRDIPFDQNDMAICEAVILMGKALKLEIIAEGVESEEQLNFLKEKGCDSGQGELFSYPVPAADIEILISERKLG